MPSPLAQDPDELFDVVSSNGEPTGIVKRRADVHRDGDWHRAIHIWVYDDDTIDSCLLMNQRGRHKDTWPLALDTTVGGHLAAGESVEQAYREIEEEIGITVDPTALRYIGQRSSESSGNHPGIIDREIQDIFFLRDNRRLDEFRPNAAELESLVRIELDDAIRLFDGDVHSIPGTRLRAQDRALDVIQVDQSWLIPVDDDYFLRVAHAIQAISQENPDVAFQVNHGLFRNHHDPRSMFGPSSNSSTLSESDG